MGAAPAAFHFSTQHAQASVGFSSYVCGNRRVEARPTGARVELCFRTENRQAASGAIVGALFVVVPVLARESPFRSLLAQD